MKPSISRLLPSGRFWVISVPYLWLFLFFLLPFAIVLKISLSQAAIAIPPYSPLFEYAEQSLTVMINLGNYIFLSEDSLYLAAYLGSLKIALISTIVCLLLGYPMALAIARAPREKQLVYLLLVMMPTWTAILIRVYAWMGILSTNGLLNNFLMWTGLVSSPLEILNTNTAVYIGVVYAYLPFMVLPLYATIERFDFRLVEVAYDLYADRWTVLFKIIMPICLPGIIAGSLLVFIPSLGSFIAPDLLGGGKNLMIGNLIALQFQGSRNWPFGSAAAMIVMSIVMVALIIYTRQQTRSKIQVH